MAVAPRGIDPSGVAPVTDPSVVGGAPDASPTTLVLQYLRQRGFTPSSENVRRALEANQRDPGVIPGLRSDRPATEAEDQAAMRAAGRGGSGGAGGLVQEEGTWDMSSGRPQGATPPMDRRDNATTSAAPASSSSSSSSNDYSMPGWGTAAAGTGLALANAILNRQPTAQFVGNAQPPSGKVTDVMPEILPNPSPMDASFARAGLGGPTATPAIAPPAAQITGPPPVAEAPVAAPGSTIVPPVTPESNAPIPFSSTSPRRPPTPAEIEALARASRTSTTLRGIGNAARAVRP